LVFYSSTLIRSSLFWDVMQHRLSVIYRHFTAAYWSHFQGSSRPVTNYQSMLCNIPEEKRYHLHQCGTRRACLLTTT